MTFPKLSKYFTRLAIAIPMIAALSACDSLVYDDLEECKVNATVFFTYNKNLHWADAFPVEVTSLRLYVFDPEGNLVWQKFERGEILATKDYHMELPLNPGKYRLVAWGGLDNEVETDRESFAIHNNFSQSSHINDLSCLLNSKKDFDSNSYSDSQLFFLYHGADEIEIPAAENSNVDFSCTINLTKNTNHVRVILNHASGRELNADDFDFRIEDSNGHMANDNTLIPSETITYRPYRTLSGNTVIGKDSEDLGSRAPQLMEVNGAIADLMTGRMMSDHAREMYLTVTAKESGQQVFRVPVIDYALLSKDYYEDYYRRGMTDQDFLDREDNYVMTFFLQDTDDYHWGVASVYIHSWRVVSHTVDVE